MNVQASRSKDSLKDIIPLPAHIKNAAFFIPFNDFTAQLKHLLDVDVADRKTITKAISAVEKCLALFKEFISERGKKDLLELTLEESNRTIELLSAKLKCLKDCIGQNIKQAEILFGLCRADAGSMFVIMEKWCGRFGER